jgi:hypothetical protein
MEKNIARYLIWFEENGKGKRPVIGGYISMYECKEYS